MNRRLKIIKGGRGIPGKKSKGKESPTGEKRLSLGKCHLSRWFYEIGKR